MAKKKTTRKKAHAKGDTDKARKDAIKDIDARLNGDAGSSKKADESKRKASTKKPAAKRKAKTAKPRKPSGLGLAAKVLAEAKEPLNAKTIAERTIAAGWETKGATPHATLYAAMIREIKAKGKDARFEKADRGQFQLRKGA